MRPKMYMPMLSESELLRYAGQYAETDLEKELLVRVESCLDEMYTEDQVGDKLDVLLVAGGNLKEAVVQCAEDLDHDVSITLARDQLLDAVEKFNMEVANAVK